VPDLDRFHDAQGPVNEESSESMRTSARSSEPSSDVRHVGPFEPERTIPNPASGAPATLLIDVRANDPTENLLRDDGQCKHP
jgi:hypothetical protein